MNERQISWAGGELSPTLWGRTDLSRYPVGARALRNFLVTSHGVLANRPGTVLVHRFTGADNAASSGDAVRLIAFPTSETDTALLLFTATDAAGVPTKMHPFERSASTGEFVHFGEIVPLGDTAAIRALRTAQVGYVLTLVSSGFAPQQIQRTGVGLYSFGPLSFDVTPFPTSPGAVRLLLATATPAFAGDASHPARQWTWAVTRIMRRTSTLSTANSDGTLYETMPQVVTQVYNTGSPGAPTPVPTSVAVYPDWAQTLKLNANAVAPVPAEDTLVATRIYRGRDGTFGYVGETTATAEWVDDGQTPDFSKPPPRGVNPFRVVGADGVLLRTENPQSVSFFEDRRYFAATAERPNLVWGSAVGDYANFDEVVLAQDDDSLSFGLTLGSSERIVGLVPKRQLLALTSAAEWMLTGSGQAENLTPNSIAAHPVTDGGSAKVPIAVARSTVFHVEQKGAFPQALVFGADGVSYQPVDVSLLAQHLFQGYTITDWAYARHPYSILWVVRSDGALLSLTYLPDEEMAAWAQHDLADDGAVEAVATVPYGSEDVVYLVVRRGAERTLERMASRVISKVRDSVFLDRAVSYDGYATVADSIQQTVTVTDDYTSGGEVGGNVLVTFSGSFGPGFVIQVDDPDGGDPVKLQLVSAVTGSSCLALVLETNVPDSMWGVAVADWALCTNEMHGVDHLDDLGVSVLADGVVLEGITVTAGVVTFAAAESFSEYAAVAHAGRPYTSRFRSLAAINEKGRLKVVKETMVEIEGARGCFIGPDAEHLTEIRSRVAADIFGAAEPERETIRMSVPDRYKEEGYVVLDQRSPLPVTILGITRDIEYGG